jgi:hypothetical protein
MTTMMARIEEKIFDLVLDAVECGVSVKDFKDTCREAWTQSLDEISKRAEREWSSK